MFCRTWPTSRYGLMYLDSEPARRTADCLPQDVNSLTDVQALATLGMWPPVLARWSRIGSGWSSDCADTAATPTWRWSRCAGTWLQGLEGAFRYFGGVPQELLLDSTLQAMQADPAVRAVYAGARK